MSTPTKIPEDWKIVKLGAHINILTGFPAKSKFFGNEGLPLIRIRDIDKDTTETGYFDD